MITRPQRLQRSKRASLGAVTALVFGFALVGASPSRAQAQEASLARYVPNRDLIAYVEFAGLDNEIAAWKGTAMYKVLNETKTGEMLEDLLAQVVEKSLKPTSRVFQKLSGTEAITLLESMFKSGFVVGLGGKPGDPNAGYGVVVFKKAFSKETKPLYGKMLANLNSPTAKATLATKGGHKVVSVVDAKLGPQIDWWVDDSKKEDLIISLRPAGTPAILETIDGTQPSAVENKLRVDLTQSAPGVTPIATAFVDAAVLKSAPLPPALGLDGLQRIDYVWGFQGKECVTVARIIAPKPRKGLLGFFDQPTFAKANLLPVPEGVEGFTVMSIDSGKLLEDGMALAQTFNPQAETQIKAFLDGFTAKSKIHLKEDVLAQIGPRMAVYSAPASKSTGGFNPLAAFTGGADIPKLTIVAEIQNPTAFARTLDSLMIEVNKQLRTAMSAPAAEAGDADAPATKRRADPKASIEFKPMPTPVSTDRAFMMSIPSQLSNFVPSYVRPTVRLHGKTLIISVAADAARQAAEIKGPGAAAKDFATTLEAVSGNLIAVSVEDPRNTLPAVLASLPGKAQALANRSKAGAAPAPGMAAGAPAGSLPGVMPGPGGAAGVISPPGGGRGGKGRGDAVSGDPVAPGPGAGGASGYPPSSTSSGGQPGPMGVPVGDATSGGGGAGASAGGSGGVVYSVDPAKMPKADEIKAHLFPNSLSVTLEDQGIKFVTRESFPNITSLFSIPALGNLPGMGGKGGPPPGGTPPPGFGPGSAPGAPGNSGGGSGRVGNKLID